MDETALGALTAIPFDDHEQARRWCEALQEANRIAPAREDWSAFVDALTDQSRAIGLREDQLEHFDNYLRDWVSDPPDTIATLCAESDLYPHYEHAIEPGQPETPAYDQEVWFAFLAEHGPYWDGDDENWPRFREWFAYEAASRDLGESAEEFLAYVEGTTDRVAAMAEYGVAVGSGEHVDREVLDRLMTYPATEDGAMEFIQAETGIDVAAWLTELDSARKKVTT